MNECKIISVKSIGKKKTYNVTMNSDQHNYKITDGINSVFSKNSHSAAYAMLAYQTAWLKCYYTIEFMCALMSSVMSEQQREKREPYEESLPRYGLGLLPYDINLSKDVYSIESGGIRRPFSILKGLGDAVIKEIVSRQPYKNLEELISFNNGRSLNKNVFETLVDCGCMSSWGNKKILLESFVKTKELVLAKNKKEKKNKEFDGNLF